MIKFITRIAVKGKSASQIYNWLLNLDQERYLQWHPAHKNYRLIKGTKGGVGSVIYFDELIDGFGINFECEVVELKENELILLRAGFFYPIYLFLSMKEINGYTEVAHELRLGFDLKGLERLLDWLVRTLVFTSKREKALYRHATEEFKNLEWLIT